MKNTVGVHLLKQAVSQSLGANALIMVMDTNILFLIWVLNTIRETKGKRHSWWDHFVFWGKTRKRLSSRVFNQLA